MTAQASDARHLTLTRCLSPSHRPLEVSALLPSSLMHRRAGERVPRYTSIQTRPGDRRVAFFVLRSWLLSPALPPLSRSRNRSDQRRVSSRQILWKSASRYCSVWNSVAPGDGQRESKEERVERQIPFETPMGVLPFFEPTLVCSCSLAFQPTPPSPSFSFKSESSLRSIGPKFGWTRGVLVVRSGLGWSELGSEQSLRRQL